MIILLIISIQECKSRRIDGKNIKNNLLDDNYNGEIILLIIFRFILSNTKKIQAHLWYLEDQEKWCIGRFEFIGMGYMQLVVLLFGCAIILCSLAILICSIISGIGKNVIINSTDRALRVDMIHPEYFKALRYV